VTSRLAALAFLLALIACGGAATTTSEGDDLELSDLSGVWANDRVTLRINDSGDFLVQPTDSAEEILMGGFVARDEGRFIFVTGVSGDCPGSQGAYRADVTANELSLTREDDPCQERAGWFEDPFIAVAGET